MAEDTEKRFQRIMDKLYHSPKPKPKPPPPSGGLGTNTLQKGRRQEPASREEVESSMRLVKATIGAREGAAPPCRPWDRGDLTRRLATFKAMTWFGKPKAIDPVNCARRGWINVEMDTLSCEACGARLLFSTPSSWTLQQVEKAAAVFSLKLDSGHKLLCPWIDNICDEALAFFPPTPAPVLIEGYKERSAALLCLSALPVISSSAIDYMRCPQLENFLAESSSLTYRLDGSTKLTDSSGSVVLDGLSEVDTSNQYYQAHKIVSLCGWKLRKLPYIVECEDHSSHSLKKDKAADSLSGLLHEKNHGVIVCSSSVSKENDEERSNRPSVDDLYDPASVVLECKLCGACVGLWAFMTTARPLELFNLIESPGEDGQNGAATGGSDGSASNEKPSNLSLTIAGGPPPIKQNFKPRISLPIVTRHLRAAFGSNGDIRNLVFSEAKGMDQLESQSSLEHQEGDNSLFLSSEASGMLKRKRSENEYLPPGCNSSDIQSHLNENVSTGVNAHGNEGRCVDASSTHQSKKSLMHEERCEQGNAETNDCLENADKVVVQSVSINEDAENGRSTADEMGDDISLQPAEGTCLISDTALLKDDEICENISSTLSEVDNDISGMDASIHGNTSQANHSFPDIAPDAIPESHVTSGAEVNKNLSGKNGTHIGGAEDHTLELHLEGSIDSQKVPLKNTVLSSVDNNVATVCTFRNKPSSASQWDSTNKFDPIWQHRPFCPWIASMGAGNMPGWKLTLRALAQDKSSSRAEGPLSFPDEANDPVVSVRKLFTSPPSKRFKGAG